MKTRAPAMRKAWRIWAERQNPFRLNCIVSLSLLQVLVGCTSIPPFKGNGSPAGPKVAALVANLKCNLWDAVNASDVLTRYHDTVALTPHESHVPGDSPRAFTLKNIFSEIEYVGQATFTLDVTQTGGFNPSVGAVKPYRSAIGDIQATSANLAVSGQLTEMAHRTLVINASVDFSRMNKGEENPFIAPAKSPRYAEDPGDCSQGMELDGDLGLEEILATGITAATMSDINVGPDQGSTSSSVNVAGVTPPVSLAGTFAFGQISSQIDFTVTEGVSGGPSWILKFVTFPGGGNLFSFQRKVFDTLVVTFVPVCIREKYWTNSIGPRYEYNPEMVEGTPFWAHFLPPCSGASHVQDQVNALAKAKSNNDQIMLQNTLVPR